MIDKDSDLECIPVVLPLRARMLDLWTKRAAEAIDQLKRIGVVEIKRPLSYWKEELAKLMAIPLTVDIPGGPWKASDDDPDAWQDDEAEGDGWEVDEDSEQRAAWVREVDEWARRMGSPEGEEPDLDAFEADKQLDKDIYIAAELERAREQAEMKEAKDR